jgi:hypothetical protein
MREVTLDLERDVCLGLAAQAAALGGSIDASRGIGRVAVDYVALLDRVIEPRCRRVHLSAELRLPVGMEAAFAAFVDASQAGRSLLPYKSDQARRQGRPDLMLLDWGIQHFHIGHLSLGGKSAIRQAMVLFARITSDSIYCIGFWPHRAWLEADVLGVVHDNWPGLLVRRRCGPGAHAPPNKDQMAVMRKCHVNYPVEVRPGVHYLSPGAPMGNGDGGRAYIWGMLLVRWLAEAEQDIRIHLANNTWMGLKSLHASVRVDGGITFTTQDGEVFATCSLPPIPE